MATQKAFSRGSSRMLAASTDWMKAMAAEQASQGAAELAKACRKPQRICSA